MVMLEVFGGSKKGAVSVANTMHAGEFWAYFEAFKPSKLQVAKTLNPRPKLCRSAFVSGPLGHLVSL